jgi:hypothetical protein
MKLCFLLSLTFCLAGTALLFTILREVEKNQLLLKNF